MNTADFEYDEREEYTNLKNRFDQFYQMKIFPFLQEKEEIRIKYVHRFWSLLFLSLFILPMIMVAIYVINLQLEKNIDISVMYIFIALAIYVMRGPFVKYKRHVKSDVMGVIVRFFVGFSYRPGTGLNQGLIKQSQIFPEYTTAEADDCFIGTYNDVNLMVCEETLKKEFRSAKGKRQMQTVFRGIAMEMGMRKPFKGQTIVVKDAGILNKFKSFDGLERVKLEDVVFEKHFEVYSSDQIEARYLLTPAFMERVLKLKKIYKGKKIAISFYANKILLAIDTRENMFEPCSFFGTNLNKKKVDKVFEQFWTIFSVIRILKLNSNTGM